VCLGAEARAANERMKKDYEYKLERREADWMHTLSITHAEQNQYKELLDTAHVGAGNVWADVEGKYGEQLSQLMQETEGDWSEFLSENVGSQRIASGQTGKSVTRLKNAALAEVLRKGSRRAWDLVQTREELTTEGAKAVGQARAAQMQSFANNSMQKVPDLTPPKPVYQNVAAAAFNDALGIAGQIATIVIAAKGSDRRLKENIKKIGESISGLGIYKFNYINQAKQYIGAMADEVLKVVPEAVVTMENGFMGVRYDLIDVNFKEVV
jgi:hypothetical protein